MPVGIEDRDADVWEPLLAVADAAGEDWPERARDAAVSLVSASKESTPSLGVRLLADLQTVFGDRPAVSTQDILTALHAMEEAPWADLRGKPLNERGLASKLRNYGIKRKQIRVGDWTGKGYSRDDLHDAWSRYLPNAAERETSETRETTQPGGGKSVTDVSDVSDFRPYGGDDEIEERAAILEYDGGLTRAEAEAQARAERGR